MSPIDNNPALVYIMVWRRIGDKPLCEPMLTQFTDIYAALGRDELSSRWEEGCVSENIKGSYLDIIKNEWQIHDWISDFMYCFEI